MNFNHEKISQSDFTDSLKEYISQMKSHKPLAKEEEWRLAKLAHEGDTEARNKLIEANLPFVISVCKGYRNRNLTMPELVSIGNEGLIKAIEKFDPDKGFKLITYAIWWIKQALGQGIMEEGNCAAMSLDEAIRVRDSEDSEECDNDELFSEYNYSEELQNKKIEENKLVQKLISSLTPREREVINLFFGIGDKDEEHSLCDLSKLYGVSIERVKQIKNMAIRKMRYQYLSETIEDK